MASKLQGLGIASGLKSLVPAESCDISFVTALSEVSVSRTPTSPGTKSPASKDSKVTTRHPSPNPSLTPVVSRPPSRLAVSPAPSPAKSEPLKPDEGPKTFKGTAGKPLNATANYLQLGVEKGKGVFEYEVILLLVIKYARCSGSSEPLRGLFGIN